MVTFVSSFISDANRRADLAADSAVSAAIRGITDSTERRRIAREVRAAHPVPPATIADVADHIEHIVKVAGIDHVGLGGDYDGTTELPVGMEDVSKYPALFAELMRRGWSDADLKKLAGENLLRAFRQAERTAARLQREREPSTATIEQLH